MLVLARLAPFDELAKRLVSRPRESPSAQLTVLAGAAVIAAEFRLVAIVRALTTNA